VNEIHLFGFFRLVPSRFVAFRRFDKLGRSNHLFPPRHGMMTGLAQTFKIILYQKLAYFCAEMTAWKPKWGKSEHLENVCECALCVVKRHRKRRIVIREPPRRRGGGGRSEQQRRRESGRAGAAGAQRHRACPCRAVRSRGARACAVPRTGPRFVPPAVALGLGGGAAGDAGAARARGRRQGATAPDSQLAHCPVPDRARAARGAHVEGPP